MRRHRSPGPRARLIALTIGGAVCALMAVLGAQQVISRETLTITDQPTRIAPATITTATGEVARECRGRLETAQVRYWTSATPTASDGILLEVGDTIVIRGTSNLETFRAIRTGATSGKLPLECAR
ncbi:MAG TPA: hypothetical protein VM364_00585 [Vicinamibacterales bacterium]|nr:hypothetical protein [Vicinamibacterales bacterium]